MASITTASSYACTEEVESNLNTISVTMIDVDAWLHSSCSSTEFEILIQHLQPEEKARVLRFRLEIDKYRSLTGRILLRWMAHTTLNVPWSQLEFGRTEENKPYLSSPRRGSFNLNVSHHGKWVAGACDHRALVGVDVMRYERPRGCKSIPAFFDTMRQYFTEYEWQDIEHTTKTTKEQKNCGESATDSDCGESCNSGNSTSTCSAQEMSQLRQFYKHWALKESYIKAVGIGLGFELSRAEFRYLNEDREARNAVMYIDGVLQKQWSFTIHEPDPEHCVVVALGPLAEATPHFLDMLTPNATIAKGEDTDAMQNITSSIPLAFTTRAVNALTVGTCITDDVLVHTVAKSANASHTCNA